MKKNPTTSGGFTLIETMVALSVLMIATIYLIGFFPRGLNTALSAKQDSVAAMLAQAKIEELIGTPYDEVATGTVVENSLSGISADFAGFSRTATVNYLDANLNDSVSDLGLKKIKVDVSWQDSLKQTSATTTLTTLITEL